MASLIKDKFYVDNLILSSNQAEILPQLVRAIKEMMQSGGFAIARMGV